MTHPEYRSPAAASRPVRRGPRSTCRSADTPSLGPPIAPFDREREATLARARESAADRVRARHAHASLLLAILALAGLAAPTRPASADDRVPFSTILDRVERHVVHVVLKFQKDLEAEASGAVGVDPDSQTENYRRWRMAMRVPGFVVRDRRTVIASDLYMAPGSIKSIEIEDRSGKTVPAVATAFLRRCGAIVLETTADVDAEPVPFATDAAVTPETPIFVASLAEGLRGFETWAESLGSARRRAFRGAGFSYGQPERGTAGLRGSRFSRTTDLVVREDGTPLGLRFGGSIDLEESVWKGADVVRELRSAVPFSALKERENALHKTSFVHQIRITYRAPDEEGNDGGSFPFPVRFTAPRRMGFGNDEPSNDDKHFGLAVTSSLLIVPEALPEASVKRIEKIVVEDEGKPPLEAAYEGRVKGWGAFVVSLKSGAVPAPSGAAVETPGAESAFLVHEVAWRAGGRRDHVEYDRALGAARGYGDRMYFASEQPVESGSFLLDADGVLMGLAADLMPEDAEASPQAGRRGGTTRAVSGTFAVLFSEVGGPAGLTKDLDKKVMPAPEQEAKRLPWLGVECEPLKKEVAEALGIEAPTRDGDRGMIVETVYEGSPAAKAGLREGDVLLSMRKTSGSGSDAPPVDLRDAPTSGSWNDDSEAPRPWRPRDGSVVRLLQAWGDGTTYDLEYLRDAATRTASLAVEQSPRDNASARKAKDDGTGLTVKELTYEVRAALRLALDAPGVLISDVKEGSPAAQARILPNELIREMDGRPVADPESFAAILKTARETNREQVRMVVARLNRTRFVDLRLARPPGDDATEPAGKAEGDR